jgi:SAM-dependent methyltransferase
MKINKILNYYFRAYNRSAAGKETARPAINIFKKIIGAKNKPVFYEQIKKHIFRLVCGPFYWPNTFPTGIDEATAGLLYNLVCLTQPNIVLEIGTAKGNAAIAIGQALEDNKKGILYTIDPIEQELVHIAIKKSGLKKRINYLIDYSVSIIPQLNLKKLDFVFIDGDHSYENCSADFNIIKPYLYPGSIVVFHDSILFPDGVGRVVKSIIKSKEFDVFTVPTLSGADKLGRAAFNAGNINDFIPAGLTICRKKGANFKTLNLNFGLEDEEEFNNKEFEEGERLYIGYQSSEEIVKEHLDRYKFAKSHFKSDFVVLDAACGTGYGSKILSEAAKKVIGLEKSRHAIAWAKKSYQKANIEFRQADLNKPLDLPDNYFDAIVSFETLEHIANQENMLIEFKRVLKPKGLLIISTPDREIITDKAGTINKFHIKELSKKEFLSLLSKYFQLDSLYGQMKYIPPSSIKRAIKLIAKLDIFKIRHWIERIFKLRRYIHQFFTLEVFSDIERLNTDEQNKYFNLIAVVRK